MVKIVCQNVYAHKSNYTELIDNVEDKKTKYEIGKIIKEHWNEPWAVCKYDKYGNKLSLIESPDWDTANEPIVGASACYHLSTGRVKYSHPVKRNPQIYHHKWSFVADNYTGFDIEEAKRRSESWENIPNLDKSKIGRKDYWVQLLTENGMEV